MRTNNSNFASQEITFEQAFDYIKRHKNLFSVSYISKRLKINRTTLSASLNGTHDKYKKANVLPKQHHQKVIDFVKSIQYPISDGDK